MLHISEYVKVLDVTAKVTVKDVMSLKASMLHDTIKKKKKKEYD